MKKFKNLKQLEKYGEINLIPNGDGTYNVSCKGKIIGWISVTLEEVNKWYESMQ